MNTETVDHGLRAHATLGASSASRWMACPASVRLSEGIISPTSKYAEEGTAAHELAEKTLRSETKLCSQFLEEEINGFEVDEEMADAVQVYVDAVLAEAEGNQLFIEQRFNLAKLNPPSPMFGTADAVIWNEKERLLSVMDLKFGIGVPVKVERSPQLSYYALGAMLAMEEHGIYPERIRMVIVQPRHEHRDGPVRSFEIDSYTLRAEWAQDLIEAANRTLEPDAEIVAGDHCKFCPAQAVCPLLHAQALEAVQQEFDVAEFAPPPPETLTEAQIVDILNKSKQFESWLASVKSFAKAKAERGEAIPGYKLVLGRATRFWPDPAETVEALKNMGLSEEEIWKKKLISPKQAEDRLGKAKREISSLIEIQKSDRLNLVPLTSRGEAILPQIGGEFGDNTLAVNHEGFENYD